MLAIIASLQQTFALVLSQIIGKGWETEGVILT